MSHEKGIEAAARAIVRNGIGELDIDQWAAESRNTFKIQAEGAIKAYLDASGMVMVPREPTFMMCVEGTAVEGEFERQTGLRSAGMVYQGMISAAPNPFQTPEESREKK